MQTQFSDAQRKDPAIRASEAILRSCVHCGFCSATCPTYALLGDELDSPRGRIYLIKDMLENDRPATAEVVRHVDRCLSCLACMTTCPSGVHYQHLVDHARAHIETTYVRPRHDRWMRDLLAAVMPYPRRFRALLWFARLGRPLAPLLPRRLRAALALVPTASARGDNETPADNQSHGAPGGSPEGSPEGSSEGTPEGSRGENVHAVPRHAMTPRERRRRVAVLTGCVQSVLGQSANEATVRLLERAGCDTVELSGCCGSLTHHLGRRRDTRQFAEALITSVDAARAGGELDAIVVNASGCGTHLKDFGYVFRDDGALSAGAAAVSRLACDISEIVAELGLPAVQRSGGLRVAYHSACSMQHGQRLEQPPRELLRAAGFEVVEIPEAHLCCGSAGTYNLLQPEIASRLRSRKVEHIHSLDADVVAAGNLGCIMQLAAGTGIPVVHTVELLDWATGGPLPAGMAEDQRPKNSASLSMARLSSRQ